MELTKEIIVAMKNATTVVARYYGHSDTHAIELITEDKNRVETSRTEIPVGGYITHGTVPRYNNIKRADGVVILAKYDDYWNTILNTVRAGDNLRLAWMFGNNSPAMMEAGFNHDKVDIEVLRVYKKSSKKFTFHLKSEFVSDPSVRMVKFK